MRDLRQRRQQAARQQQQAAAARETSDASSDDEVIAVLQVLGRPDLATQQHPGVFRFYMGNPSNPSATLGSCAGEVLHPTCISGVVGNPATQTRP